MADNLLNAKYLNPACAEHGCQFLARDADVERLKAERDEAREIAELLVEVRAVDAVGKPAEWQQQVKAMLEAPVPPTIAMDDAFREIYCQGYRHALSDVLRRFPAPPAVPER